ncbi:alpha 1,4-glycosyltransferase family protein [Arabidopsis lyrata subsp. lyrata]|uniref:Alpha 1,4-glycosyltransferase family protein n=2 Tax=Arabidopsis lyrata subsp. lyrata TaxID=81972 RepID=D7KW57_ARALL|nr:alpha 1,4-glycosyltransferase family protein [Arabidopsis lyrata subsp. lyrata]
MEQSRRTEQVLLVQRLKRLIVSFVFCLPMSLLGLLLMLLLIYNSFSVFSLHLVPTSPIQSTLSPTHLQILHHQTSTSSSQSDSSLLLVVKETSLGFIQKQNVSSTRTERKTRRFKRRTELTSEITQRLQVKSRQRFKTKFKSFLSKSSCESLFFMTWISSIESFGDRERFTIESLFKFHPNSCLILVSNSFDCDRGTLILKPFTDKGLKVLPIKPDFAYIFKDTSAEKWFERLKKGTFSPGVIPLEQNLSNLLRLVLLYKYGGIYLDTDVIILKSLSNLHNVIGAQTVDPVTRKWSRLNNAVLIFDKNHPLLKRFIDEFSRTFNGNKWGHNGPYLVSRVIARINISSSSDLGFSVLPPSAFYPVDWTRIKGFYRAPTSETEANWLRKRLTHLRKNTFAVHLWNRESKKLRIEEGSIIHQLMSYSCIFCNSSSLHLS